MQRIVIAGMIRSASTWQYNTVRLGLEMAGHSVYGCYGSDYSAMGESEYHVVKSHEFMPELLPAKVLMTVRDIKSAHESHSKLVGGNAGIDVIMGYMRNFFQWMMYSDYVMSYESIMFDKVIATKMLMDELEFKRRYK